MNILPIFAFASFVWWLLAFPMAGPLLAAAGIAHPGQLFLVPQIATLALLGCFCTQQRFTRLMPAGVVLTVVLTLAMTARPGAAVFLLPCLGVAGAFVAIQACSLLKTTRQPVVSAALGLVLANLLLALLYRWPHASPWLSIAVTLPLLLLLMARPLPPTADEPPPTAVLLHYLPFLLVFHLVSGLMYSFIFPAYEQNAYLPGAELPFYMATVLAGVWLVKKSRDLTLICGVVLAMAAFALLQYPHPLNLNLSMFAMQAGVGFIDLFFLALLLCLPQPVRTFGIGQAVLCLGIAGGQFLGGHLGPMAEAVALSGHVILNLSVITLFFLTRRHSASSPPAHAEMQTPSIRIPDNIRLLISEREFLVLARVLEGRTYRETALELKISESSVKTYMKRTYEKLGVSGKNGLLKVLSE